MYVYIYKYCMYIYTYVYIYMYIYIYIQVLSQVENVATEAMSNVLRIGEELVVCMRVCCVHELRGAICRILVSPHSCVCVCA